MVPQTRSPRSSFINSVLQSRKRQPLEFPRLKSPRGTVEECPAAPARDPVWGWRKRAMFPGMLFVLYFRFAINSRLVLRVPDTEGHVFSDFEVYPKVLSRTWTQRDISGDSLLDHMA